MSGKGIWRKPVLTGTHLNPGHARNWAVGGNNHITLEECGHTLARKISRGVPARIRCLECEGARDGRRGRSKHGDGPWTIQDWDPVRGIGFRRECRPEEVPKD